MNQSPAFSWTGRSVLVTGACGTIGSELLRQLADMDCGRIVGLDNNEGELFFQAEGYAHRSNVRLALGDLRDRDKLMREMRGIDTVLHAAALKNVLICEENPRDAVQTNVDGMINVIDAAEANKVERVLFTSSDKAVNPTNVMGTTKLMGERLMTSANAHPRSDAGTIFASTRFGNVLGSRGSVVPLFKRQIAAGGPVSLTDDSMTRFIMTLSEAANMVLDSTGMARGGEVFVTKMIVVRIIDLAEVMIELLAPHFEHRPEDIEIKRIGVRPGEKMYEELVNEEEIRRTIELDRYFCVLPAFKAVYDRIEYEFNGERGKPIDMPYNSDVEEPLSKDELRRYFVDHDILGLGEGLTCDY